MGMIIRESKKSLNNKAKSLGYPFQELLNIGGNAKTIKGDKQGKYLTAILYLAPSNTSGYQVCPARSKGCEKSCLYTAGRGAYDNVQACRINRTKFFFEQRDLFKKLLVKEIELFSIKCVKLNVKPTVRLNGTSDIIWEKTFPELFELFPDVIFYDYTKIVGRFNRRYMLPKNYFLLFSKTESNDKNVKKVLDNGENVAIVFSSKKLPKTYKGYKVINGDKTDLRFRDKKGVVVGLYAKGRARKDKSGFVVLT